MSLLAKFASQKQEISRAKSVFSNGRRTKLLSLSAALILSLFGGISFVIIKSGAQELKPSESESKPQKYVNQDVRINNQANLTVILRRNFADEATGVDVVREKAQAQALTVNAEVSNLKKRNPTVEATLSPLTGAIEVLRSATALTAARPGVSGERIVRDFIENHKDLYGLAEADIAELNFVGESASEVSGMRMVIVEQNVNGHFVFQSDTKFILDRDGRLIQSVGTFIPKASERAAMLDNLISPQEALRAALETVGVTVAAEKINLLGTKVSEETKTSLKVESPEVTDQVTSRMVYFPAAPGVLIPAWSQIVFGTDADWYILVDAADGTLLWRKNIRAEQSTQPARFRVYVQADGVTPADNPAPSSPTTATVGSGFQPPAIAPTIVNMLTAQNITASPNGWINDCPGGVCTAAETRTEGNNTITCLDRIGGTAAGGADQCDTAASSVLDGNGMPIGNPDASGRNRDFLGTTPRDFQTNYLPPPQSGNPESGQTPTGDGSSGTLPVDQFRRGMVTHLFYLTNYYHDRLYSLGFTPAARNFQTNNFGGGAAGNDRVLGDAQDGGGTNNANFSTPPDGTSGRMQMYVFTGPTVDRDGSLDAEIVLHELTHGLSNRLIGNGAGLVWEIGGGMGEGWSDFYALSLLNNTNADLPNGNYASGSYATYKLAGLLDNYVYGIRRFPYSTNNSVNPLTWADIDQTTNNLSGGITPDPLGFNNGGALEVHNSGEIWANTLWEVRSRVIADPAGANGSVPIGNNTMLAIVTDAMKLTPSNPSFIQARNALIDADCATNACANEASIWAGFADRGLGFYASVPNTHGFAPAATHIGVKESFETPKLNINTVTINDSAAAGGNNSGFVDPGERVLLTVNLTNPLRRAGSNAATPAATLTTSTSGVVVTDNSSSYPTIAPQANAVGDTFSIRVPANAACGSALKFTLNITSSLGTVSRDFVIRLGQPSGTSAPIIYSSANTTPTAIADNRPNGTLVPVTITDDFEIADLNVRINSITHTYPGDLTVGIKSPSGYGTDVVDYLGGAVSGGGNGDNITNMLIDQQSAGGDILLATNAQAPYTGSWLPVASSPSWAALGFGPSDTTELNRLNGTSTQGTWSFVVSDQVGGDVGTVNPNGLSLIVTPRAFVCTSFVPTAAQVSIGGRVLTPEGRLLKGALVTITDAGGGAHTAVTGLRGAYRFAGVRTGETYILTVISKRYRFLPQVVTAGEDLENVDFTAEP